MELFSAYNFGKSSKNQLIHTFTVSYNILLYRDPIISIHSNCVSLHLYFVYRFYF